MCKTEAAAVVFEKKSYKYCLNKKSCPLAATTKMFYNSQRFFILYLHQNLDNVILNSLNLVDTFFFEVDQKFVLSSNIHNTFNHTIKLNINLSIFVHNKLTKNVLSDELSSHS